MRYVVVWVTYIGVNDGESPVVAVDGPFCDQRCAVQYAEGVKRRHPLADGWSVRPLTGPPEDRAAHEQAVELVRERRTGRGYPVGNL